MSAGPADKDARSQALTLLDAFGNEAPARARERINAFQQTDDFTMLRHWYLVAAYIKDLTIERRRERDTRP
ncbi:hypothetical protein KGY14_09265 [Ameyamaea chiangmaiensis]|uniref:Uncharacterized protein n=1 Tax=Ameyamaea chiangmaiensis TaxID=442969 RepID=A0A850P7F5_9PROT|nr:hypothetical protein [Ameyamaea chiangmaiensis]MBS4075379.1 hypothetical protein [Ameyamaea chiangmaiensis]NVN39868.1 hypothetical protein [Ameyamaea chiangmaiensis]